MRVLGSFPKQLRQVTRGRRGAGQPGRPHGRRLAAAGAPPMGDAVWRWYYGDGVKGWGLRGGTSPHYPGGRARIRLPPVRWTTDTAVSGTSHLESGQRPDDRVR